MPIVYRPETAETIWVKEEPKPALIIGHRNPAEQRKGTVIATARAMSLGMSEDEFEEILKKNASTAKMEIEELRELALEELQRQYSEE